MLEKSTRKKAQTMDIIFIPLLAVIKVALGIYAWIVIISVIMTWLVNFNVINSHNNFVLMAMDFLYKTTEPVLRQIRRFLPAMGGLDFSPFVLILFLWFLQMVIGRLMIKVLLVSSV